MPRPAVTLRCGSGGRGRELGFGADVKASASPFDTARALTIATMSRHLVVGEPSSPQAVASAGPTRSGSERSGNYMPVGAR